ncbi:hypothetical protein AXF42_Ash003347 [Apostasia shenzhenica]|uniref:Uncharacterized protein n=1 Tax=Apostasia shenzhenica TaxID=1088818 RepID=A0A2I0BFZ8_9ASPA|nr:hypothetical protein AXF42_Ash003347 [Apostasia shenzhenica]
MQAKASRPSCSVGSGGPKGASLAGDALARRHWLVAASPTEARNGRLEMRGGSDCDSQMGRCALVLLYQGTTEEVWPLRLNSCHALCAPTPKYAGCCAHDYYMGSRSRCGGCDVTEQGAGVKQKSLSTNLASVGNPDIHVETEVKAEKGRKSLEICEDKPQNNQKIRYQLRPEQQEQQQQQEPSALMEKDKLIGMSLSPSDIRVPIEPSAIDDDIDDISRKYDTSNTNSFHMKPAIPVHDFSRQSSGERMQVRTYGMHDEEDHRQRANEYGLSSEEGIRMHVRTYGMQGDEGHSPGVTGYGRTEEDIRKQVRGYGMQSGEDHRPRNMFSLGAGQESGFSSLHQSSNFRLSSNVAETPTLERFALRLDEMNYPAPPHVSPGIPFAGRDDQFDRHSMRHDMPPSPYSFMPGTYSSFPNPRSQGCVDD